jgi:uncharacterized protein YggE
MTISLAHRRVAFAMLAVITLAAVYLVGASRSGASTRASDPSPAPSSTNPAVGDRGLAVSARSEVAGTPDTLRLDLSVVATGGNVSEALAKANGSAQAVQKSLLANGVTRKDLQTSGLSIQPSYQYSNGGTPRVKGYEVTQSVKAKLRDLPRAGDAIGRVVAAGGNAVRVDGISLDLEETGALVSKARERAFAQAKAKAEQYARVAGRSVGEVLSIAENLTDPSPVAVAYSAKSGAPASADVPVQPGSQEVAVAVTVVFAMG